MTKSFEYHFEYNHPLGDGWQCPPMECQVEIIDKIHGWDIGAIRINGTRQTADDDESQYVDLHYADPLTSGILKHIKSQHEMEISRYYALMCPDDLSDIRHSQKELV